jgi:hypothetical protein
VRIVRRRETEPPGTEPKRRRRRRLAALAAATVVGEVIVPRRRGYRFGSVIVRCGHGHLFSTIWLPAASVKSLRLGPWRIQRCPVGRHWSLVTQVDPATLTDEERSAAAAAKDIRLP